MNKNSFSWDRFLRLTLNTIRDERKNMLQIGVLIGAILFFLPLSSVYIGKAFHMENFFKSSNIFTSRDFFFIITFWVAAIFLMVKASHAFPELKDKVKATEFISLPGTILEKVLSRYLLCSIGIIVFVIAVAVCFMAVLSCFVEIRNVFSVSLAHPVLPVLFLLMIQAFCFVGALYFKSMPGFKTILCYLLYYGLVFGLFSYIFTGYFVGWWGYVSFYLSGAALVFNIAAGALLYVICLCIIYFRVKEIEINEI